MLTQLPEPILKYRFSQYHPLTGNHTEISIWRLAAGRFFRDAEQSHGHHLQAARMRASSSLQRELLGREGSEGLRRVGLGREEKAEGVWASAGRTRPELMHSA